MPPCALCWRVLLALSVGAVLDSSPAPADGSPAAPGCRSARDCSDHGACLEAGAVDGGVCLCQHGWFGGNCSHALEGWAKMHRLEHNFYEHDAFKSRYILAAHHLRHCKHIVEIGGYRTPISEAASLSDSGGTKSAFAVYMLAQSERVQTMQVPRPRRRHATATRAP